MKTQILAISIALAIGACTPIPEKTKPDDAQAVVDAMTYVKSKAGPCYGVVTVSRISSNGSLAENQMIVAVECSEVGF